MSQYRARDLGIDPRKHQLIEVSRVDVDMLSITVRSATINHILSLFPIGYNGEGAVKTRAHTD